MKKLELPAPETLQLPLFEPKSLISTLVLDVVLNYTATEIREVRIWLTVSARIANRLLISNDQIITSGDQRVSLLSATSKCHNRSAKCYTKKHCLDHFVHLYAVLKMYS